MLERLSAALTVVAALSGAACSHAPPQPAAPPAQIGPWGLDLAARDTSVKPGDDFYRYAEGHWFLAYAQIWRSLNRDEQLRSQVLSNPHSPPKFRVNGVVRNVNAWYAAFEVQPADQLYLNEDERVHIW